MAIYSAGSASVQIVPDFTNAQRSIGRWFAGQKDIRVPVKSDVDHASVVKANREIAAGVRDHKIHIDIDRRELAKTFVESLDFLTGTSMVQGALRKLFDIKPTLYANVGGMATMLAQQLGQAAGAAALLPAGIAAAALPMASLVVGSQGIVDAFKAIGSGDAKKVAAALKDLAPAARDFVRQTAALSKEWKAARFDIQEKLFAGLGDKMSALGTKGIPVLRRGLGGLTAEFNLALGSVMDFLATGSNLADFSHVFDNVKAVLHEIVLAIKPLLQAFFDLITVGSDFLPTLVAGFGDLAQHFADFIRTARQSGDLQKFMSGALSALGDVLKVVINLGSAIQGIFAAAAPYAQAFTGILKYLTSELAAFMHSAEAKTGLSAFFGDIVKVSEVLAPALLDIAKALVTAVLPAMGGFTAAVAPVVAGVLTQFADLLRELSPLFYPALANALQIALGALAPLIGVFTQIAKTVLPPVIEAVKRLAPLFATLAEGVGTILVKALHDVAPLLPKLVEAVQAIAEALVPFILGVGSLVGDVLPPLVSILGFVAAALEKLAPLLPEVLTAFLAYKAVSAITSTLGGFSGALATLSQNIAFATYKTPALAGAAGVAQTGIGKLRGAIGSLSGFLGGPFGIAVGVAAVGFSILGTAAAQADAELAAMIDTLTKVRIRETLGGNNGRAAAEELRGYTDDVKRLTGELDNYKVAAGSVGGEADVAGFEEQRRKLEELKAALEGSKQKIQQMKEELGPLGFAQAQVTLATEDWNKAMASGTPAQQASALQELKTAQANVATETQLTNDATKTQLQLMQETRDKILEAANAQIAYENEMARGSTAVDTYNKTLKDGTLNDAQRAQAERDLRSEMLQAAQAAADKAKADHAGETATQQAKAALDAQITTLQGFADKLQGPAKKSVEDLIKSLKNSSSTADWTRSQMEELGVSIVKIPNDKTVVINAPTADQEAKLRALGYHITHLPDGTVSIRTDAAQKALDAFINQRRVIQIQTAISTGHLYQGVGGGHSLEALGGIVKAFANGGLFQPMAAGIAQVVKPNTWRIIGDRVTDDEAYIPITNTPRSEAILAQTADAMGFGLVANAQGNYWMPPGMASAYYGPGSLNADRRRAVATGVGPSTVAGFVNHGTVVTTDLDELARKARVGTQRALAVAGL